MEQNILKLLLVIGSVIKVMRLEVDVRQMYTYTAILIKP